MRYPMSKAVCAGLAVLLCLTTGCTSGQQPVSSLTSPSTTSGATDVAPAGSSSVGQADVAGWAGEYSFAEVDTSSSGQAKSVIAYGLSIYPMGADYFAAVTVTQTDSSTRDSTTQAMTAAVQGDETTISLVFSAYIGANPSGGAKYKAGNTLLKLGKQSDGIVTTWVSLRPKVSGNDSAGFYFKLITSSGSASPVGSATP